jgi:hypothetical protein
MTAGVLLFCALLLGHDPTLHRTKTMTGQIVIVSENGLELKTRTGAVKVILSAKTKFSEKKKPVDKDRLRAGEWAGVVGNEQHNGEFLATEVILGLPAPPSNTKKP